MVTFVNSIQKFLGFDILYVGTRYRRLVKNGYITSRRNLGARRYLIKESRCTLTLIQINWHIWSLSGGARLARFSTYLNGNTPRRN